MSYNNVNKTEDEEDDDLASLRIAALKSIAAKSASPPQHQHQGNRNQPHNIENHAYNYQSGGRPPFHPEQMTNYRPTIQPYGYNPHNQRVPPHNAFGVPLSHQGAPHHIQHLPQQGVHAPFMNNSYHTGPGYMGGPPNHIHHQNNQQLWDRDYNSMRYSTTVPLMTNVQLSPRSQAFVAENNDILLRRKGDRFLRRSISKSWSRSPSPPSNGGLRRSPGNRRKRSLSASSNDSGGKHKCLNKKLNQPPRGRRSQSPNKKSSPQSKTEAQNQSQPTARRRGGSPISFGSEKKEPSTKVILNRNRTIGAPQSRQPFNKNPRQPQNHHQRPNQPWQAKNIRNQRPGINEEDKKRQRKTPEKTLKSDDAASKKSPTKVTSPTTEVTPTLAATSVPPTPPTPPKPKPVRIKTAEEILEDELLGGDDDDEILLTDDLDIDLFASESESENEGRFKSSSSVKSSNTSSLNGGQKGLGLSFAKLGEKSVAKVKTLDDVIDRADKSLSSGGSSRNHHPGRDRGYFDKNKKFNSANSTSAGSGGSNNKINSSNSVEKRSTEFRKLALDRKIKKSFDKEPTRRVIIGSREKDKETASASSNKGQQERKSIYSRLGGKTEVVGGSTATTPTLEKRRNEREKV